MSIYVLVRKRAIILSHIIFILATMLLTITLPSKAETHLKDPETYEEICEDRPIYRMISEAQTIVQSPNFWAGVCVSRVLSTPLASALPFNNAHYLNMNWPDLDELRELSLEKMFWATVKKEANITDLRIHDLRHTYASHLVSSGVSLSAVGKLLGHSNVTTTERYGHLADQVLRDATNVMSNKIANLKKNAATSQES